MGSGDEERLLCPVRALSPYLRRTSSEPRPRILFLSAKCPSTPTSKAAISSFLRGTSSQRTTHPLTPHAPRPRSVHMTSGAGLPPCSCGRLLYSHLLKGKPLEDYSVSADHYLRDIVRQDGDVFTLGPVVAAGHIVL